MNGSRNVSEEPIPYELTSEQLATEEIRHIEDTYGTNPYVIMAYLPTILQEFGHNCLELGMGIADKFPDAGVADILEAYSAGLTQERMEKGE